MGVKISATGHYLPPRIMKNEELTTFLDTSDEWIVKRTGIKQRHLAENECTADLAAKAAQNVLEQRDVSASELDFIIIATMTPDANSPSTACMVQELIGAKNAFCFDINAACTGFVYALSVGIHLMRSGMYQKGLVLGAETMSKILNWEDRSTAVIFGDGAGGLLLEPSEEDSFIAEDLNADGTRGQALTAGRNEKKETAGKMDPLVMDGRSIFDFVSRNVPQSILTVLEQAHTSVEEIDTVVAHQANLRLLDVLSKKTKIDRNKFISNIETCGNTSAASIPILLDQKISAGSLQLGSKQKVLFTGFGGGLTWGSILLKL